MANQSQNSNPLSIDSFSQVLNNKKDIHEAYEAAVDNYITYVQGRTTANLAGRTISTNPKGGPLYNAFKAASKNSGLIEPVTAYVKFDEGTKTFSSKKITGYRFILGETLSDTFKRVYKEFQDISSAASYEKADVPLESILTINSKNEASFNLEKKNAAADKLAKESQQALTKLSEAFYKFLTLFNNIPINTGENAQETGKRQIKFRDTKKQKTISYNTGANVEESFANLIEALKTVERKVTDDNGNVSFENVSINNISSNFATYLRMDLRTKAGSDGYNREYADNLYWSLINVVGAINERIVKEGLAEVFNNTISDIHGNLLEMGVTSSITKTGLRAGFSSSGGTAASAFFDCKEGTIVVDGVIQIQGSDKIAAKVSMKSLNTKIETYSRNKTSADFQIADIKAFNSSLANLMNFVETGGIEAYKGLLPEYPAPRDLSLNETDSTLAKTLGYRLITQGDNKTSTIVKNYIIAHSADEAFFGVGKKETDDSVTDYTLNDIVFKLGDIKNAVNTMINSSIGKTGESQSRIAIKFDDSVKKYTTGSKLQNAYAIYRENSANPEVHLQGTNIMLVPTKIIK